ncbi:MAG: amidohydrolase family protein [Firmicutes bacterium]|nr:amidohydrolase family protein [Bacillota bacterium]
MTWRRTRLVCDCHCHVGAFYDELKGQQVSCRADILSGLMVRAGVDIALVSCIGASRDPVKANSRLLDELASYSGLLPVLWVTPGSMSVEVAAALVSQGFLGLKFHPTMGRYQADSTVVDPYLELCRKHRIPALFHCAADDYCAPERYAWLAKRFPDVDIILAHMNLFGNPWDAVRVAEEHERVYLDTSWAGPEAVLYAYRRLGPAKILWGTDAPLGGQSHYRDEKVRKLVESELPEHDAGLILFGNAARLYRLR